MSRRPRAALAGVLFALSCAGPAANDRSTLRDEVVETERAFARTMADRDHAAFTTFLSEEAVFLSGPTPLRGKDAVAGHWARWFEGDEAPFSWEPEEVAVLDSGTLALSTGPVRNPAGEVIATFTSIWRLESAGTWRIVFDKGDEACPPSAR